MLDGRGVAKATNAYAFFPCRASCQEDPLQSSVLGKERIFAHLRPGSCLLLRGKKLRGNAVDKISFSLAFQSLLNGGFQGKAEPVLFALALMTKVDRQAFYNKADIRNNTRNVLGRPRSTATQQNVCLVLRFSMCLFLPIALSGSCFVGQCSSIQLLRYLLLVYLLLVVLGLFCLEE